MVCVIDETQESGTSTYCVGEDNRVEILTAYGEANVDKVTVLNTTPTINTVMQFFYNYWYLIALIILAIIIVASL